MFSYRDAEGTQESKPLAIEVNGNTVYIRKRIQRKSRTTESGTLSYWSYKEAILTVAEYMENQVAIENALETEKIIEDVETALCDLSDELSTSISDLETALCDLSTAEV